MRSCHERGRRPLIRSLAMLASLWMAADAVALDIQLVHAAGTLRGAPVLQLEPIALTELGARERTPVPAGSGTVVADGRSLAVRWSGLELPALVPMIERELPVRWQVRLPPERSAADLQVLADWSSPGGQPNAVEIAGKSARSPVSVRVEGPWLLSADERGQVMEGTVVLRMPLSVFERPGQLAGQLRLEATLK